MLQSRKSLVCSAMVINKCRCSNAMVLMVLEGPRRAPQNFFHRGVKFFHYEKFKLKKVILRYVVIKLQKHVNFRCTKRFLNTYHTSLFSPIMHLLFQLQDFLPC
jgi:hypothetical protein